MRHFPGILLGVLLLGALALIACGDEAGERRDRARESLAEWFGVSEDSFEYIASEEALWPDLCLGVTWAGRTCEHLDDFEEVEGHRLTFRAPSGQPHYVHVSEDGELAWAPASGTAAIVVSREGNTLGIDVGRTEPVTVRLVPGSTVEAQLTPGERVIIGLSNPVQEDDRAAAVVFVATVPE